MSTTDHFTAFAAFQRLASGNLADVAVAVRKAERDGQQAIIVVNDANGKVVDLDTRGSEADVRARYTPAEATRGPGRPKLGVVSREVSLLPRHWEWLASQPGGASVALRKLVDDARRRSGDDDRRRAAVEAAYHFMSAVGGDLPGFEEAARSLFAADEKRFQRFTKSWPRDVRRHAHALAFGNAATSASE